MQLRDKSKKYHFVGIGGAGMSSLAGLLLAQGHQVSGSDKQGNAQTDELEKKGAVIHIGHKPENVSGADYLVFSSAVHTDNPERRTAQRLGIESIRRAGLLGQLMKRHFGIGVAGTHGKTTTSLMIDQMMISAGLDPTAVIGGVMQGGKSGAHLGNSAYFVTEADEYDRSFLTLEPSIAVITNLEEDHLDIYKDLNDLKTTFTEYANQTLLDGLVILCADDERLMDIRPAIHRSVLTYGIENPADVRAGSISFKGMNSMFDVFLKGKNLGRVKLIVPGMHNVRNALAAIIVGLEIDIPFEKIALGLQAFRGVERRFQIMNMYKGCIFMDDYAHHPSEVAATISAVRKGWQEKLTVIFQPHLFSRTRDFFREFGEALAQADSVILAPVYPAREEAIAGVSAEMIGQVIREKKGGNFVQVLEDKMEITNAIVKNYRPGQILMTMGAGDIWKYGEEARKIIMEENDAA